MSLSHTIERQIEGFVQEEAGSSDGRKFPDDNTLIKGIRARLQRQQDARILIAGEPGVGKSALSLVIAQIVNPKLYIEQKRKAVDVGVSFTGKQYLFGVRTLSTGDYLDFDEPAQGMFHRQFMTEVNMILSKTFIGFRYKRFVSGLSVPLIDLLDIDAVKLATYFIWVDSQGHSTVYRILPSRFGGDPFFKVIIDSMKFPKPDSELWSMYEERKFANQDSLYDTFDKRLDELNAPKLTMREMVDIIVEHPERFYKEVGGKDEVHYSRIQEEFGVGVNRGYTLKHMAMGEIARKKSKESATDPSSPSLSPSS